MMGNTDIKIFNLCRGDEKYKYDMGGRELLHSKCKVDFKLKGIIDFNKKNI